MSDPTRDTPADPTQEPSPAPVHVPSTRARELYGRIDAIEGPVTVELSKSILRWWAEDDDHTSSPVRLVGLEQLPNGTFSIRLDERPWARAARYDREGLSPSEIRRRENLNPLPPDAPRSVIRRDGGILTVRVDADELEVHETPAWAVESLAWAARAAMRRTVDGR